MVNCECVVLDYKLDSHQGLYSGYGILVVATFILKYLKEDDWNIRDTDIVWRDLLIFISCKKIHCITIAGPIMLL